MDVPQFVFVGYFGILVSTSFTLAAALLAGRDVSYVRIYLHHQSSARVSTAAKARDVLFLVVVVVYSVLLQTVHVVGGYFVRGSRDLRWGLSFVDCETKPLCRLQVKSSTPLSRLGPKFKEFASRPD